MDFINPLATSILQSTQLQAQESAEKRRQVQKKQALLKDVAAQDDEMEHQVESAEALASIHDQEANHQDNSKKKHHHGSNTPEDDDGQAHLDLTA